ncbi:glycoside hydrolase family 16 protein [Calycina marina]|uniref:Crh-like protein n=1 Tax=Calycina marina TaxID=1763456 RepID=A0A9P8CJ19_9HELO|nr:glycoside hydrolase family 16 protein [Calycina marina]
MLSNIFSISSVATLLFTKIVAQTYSTCNPLTSTECAADTALGEAISVDFTQGEVNSFTAQGTPTYDTNGVSFTVTESGDAPQLISLFYIMFGKVEITMKAAAGDGIVSTLVLQSDDLDEIDMEWLGADDTEVQTNYFGKGNVTAYNRGEFNPAADNQDSFITYTIEWTQTQITWSVGSTVIRVLTPDTADTDQYPQTPMQVKFGAWSGGDSSNAAGTISWARGPTDYSNGPFTMLVKNIGITDYSTGTQYTYGDQTGDWTSINAVGGSINGNSNGAAATVASADVPAATSASPSIPAGIAGNTNGDIATRTGWPWVASTLATAPVSTSTYSLDGIPDGWTIASDGKVVPTSSAAMSMASSTPPMSTTTASLPPFLSSQLPVYDTVTGWDNGGFKTTHMQPADWATVTKNFNDQGCR